MFVCCPALTPGKTQKKKKLKSYSRSRDGRFRRLPHVIARDSCHGRVSDGGRVSFYRVGFFLSFTVISEKHYTLGRKFSEKKLFHDTGRVLQRVIYLLAAKFELPSEFSGVVRTEK